MVRAERRPVRVGERIYDELMDIRGSWEEGGWGEGGGRGRGEGGKIA
jgi:hypothetical protein